MCQVCQKLKEWLKEKIELHKQKIRNGEEMFGEELFRNSRIYVRLETVVKVLSQIYKLIEELEKE